MCPLRLLFHRLSAVVHQGGVNLEDRNTDGLHSSEIWYNIYSVDIIPFMRETIRALGAPVLMRNYSIARLRAYGIIITKAYN